MPPSVLPNPASCQTLAAVAARAKQTERACNAAMLGSRITPIALRASAPPCASTRSPRSPPSVPASAMFVIESRMTVTGPGMKDPLVLKGNITEVVNGAMFLRLSKSDHVVERLLLGKSSASSRPLSETDIFETLATLRYKAISNIISPPPVEDLGIHEPAALPPAKRRALEKEVDVPPIVDIAAPTIEDIVGIPMRVLKGSAGSALWVELTPAILAYLSAVVHRQLQEPGRKGGRPRRPEAEGLERVSWESRRGAYRARRADGKQRYFSATSHVDPAAAAATWAAEAPPSEAGLPEASV